MRIPLATRILTRDGSLSKDGKMVNVWMEPQPDGAMSVAKRPGLISGGVLAGSPVQGAGLYQDRPFAVASDTLFGLVSGGPTPLPAPSAFNQRMDLYDVGGTTPFGIVKSVFNMWKVTGAATVTKVIDPDYPSGTTRGAAILDGTVYVANNNSIRGSAINDPLSWDPLNVISVDSGIGNVFAITRHLNYVLVIATQGLQLFYNAGNPPPGSPLLPLGNATYQTGTTVADSLVSLADQTIFVSKSKVARGKSISVLSGLSVNQISTPYIDKILDTSTFNTVYAFGMTTFGHPLYVLTLADVGKTLVYDFLTKEWYVWASGASGSSYFAPVFYTCDQTFQPLGASDFLLDVSGNIYNFSNSTYTDAGSTIYCLIRTRILDLGSIDPKSFSRVNLIGDTVNSTVDFSISRDDYSSYSAVRQIDLSTERKLLTRMGRYRRASFDIIHTANTPFRLLAMEIHPGNDQSGGS